MHGLLGAAAVKLVEVEFSRDTESVKGLSSVVNPVPVKRGSRSAAMKGDALVSDRETVKKSTYKTILLNQENNCSPQCLYPYF